MNVPVVIHEEERHETVRVALNGRPLGAVGLFWQTVQDDSVATARREALATARDQRFAGDFICVRGGDVVQYGIAWRGRKGVKPGVPALAAALCAAGYQSLLGAFDVDDGVWIADIDNGSIAPEGDRFFPIAELDRAKAYFRARRDRGKSYDSVFAPVSWQVPETQPGDLEELLSAIGAIPRLRPVWLLPQLLQPQVLLAVAVVLLVSAGIGLYWHHQSVLEAERLLQEEEAAAARRFDASKIQVPHPWLGAPWPSAALAMCETELWRNLDFDVVGWERAAEPICGFHRQFGTVVTIWKRAGGAIGDLKRTLAVRLGTAATVSYAQNGDQVTVSDQFLSPSARSKPPRTELPLVDQASLQFGLIDLAQRWGQKITVNGVSAVHGGELIDYHPPVPATGLLAGTSIMLDTNLRPSDWSVLDRVPGLVIEGVSPQPGGLSWRLDARVYVAGFDEEFRKVVAARH